MRRIRYFFRLLRDVGGMSRYTGASWMVPVVVLLVLAVVLAVASSAAVPYVVYTFF